MYQVFAFYPNIDLKVRVTEYKTKAEAYEYISGLRMCETPYIGQSGDWCNECPGFDRDDCFKLKEKYREEWLKIDG